MKKKKSTKEKLSAKDIEHLKSLLLAKRNDILGDVNSMEDETLRKANSDLSRMPTHMADLGSDNFEIENTLGLMDSERKLLKEIDDALDRIENGTFGICEGTGESITKKRLEAIPWARYSVKYAQMLEQGLATEPPANEGSNLSKESDEEADLDLAGTADEQ